MPMLRIKGKEQKQKLSVSLAGILNCIDDGASNKWMVQWIDAIGSPTGINVPKFEKAINTSAHGVLYSFNDLLQLESLFYLLIGLLIVGDTDGEKLNRYDTVEALHNNCDYVIELVDGIYWAVSTENYRALANMQKMEGVITF